MNFDSFRKALLDEGHCFEVAGQLRRTFIPGHMPHVEVLSSEHAIERATRVFFQVLVELDLAQNINSVEPGHGLGHITRDFLNALLLRRLDIEPKELFIGLLGGMLHDIGCMFVPRYEEPTRAVRHAEASALLLAYIWRNANDLGLNSHELVLLQYALAAHTHYLGASEVRCSDGAMRRIEPYPDTDVEEGNRLHMFVWLTRWIDRLDCCGPAYAARHYLTTLASHSDFDGRQFYAVDFANHMRPLLRTADQIKSEGGSRTILEHLAMLARSQNNESPYGKHDFGEMVRLRDRLRSSSERIISAVLSGSDSVLDEETVLKAWTVFLGQRIEPTQIGATAAVKLEVEFRRLPKEIRLPWINGFFAIMREYVAWVQETKSELDGVPDWYFVFPTFRDVRKFLF